MAILTITVPDELLQRACLRAAQEGTSVSHVLRSSLARYVDDDAVVGEAWDRFLDLAGTSAGRSPAGRRTWDRSGNQRELGDDR